MPFTRDELLIVLPALCEAIVTIADTKEKAERIKKCNDDEDKAW